MTNWFEKRMKEIGYKGCQNCKHQIEPFRACEWLEQGKHQTVYLVCPRWEMRENETVRKSVDRTT